MIQSAAKETLTYEIIDIVQNEIRALTEHKITPAATKVLTVQMYHKLSLLLQSYSMR